MNKNLRHTVYLISVLVIFCIWCFFSYQANEKEPWNVICIIKTDDSQNGFWKTLKKGVYMAANDYEVNVEIYGSQKENDVEEQNRLIEKAIEKRPDAVLLAAADAEKTLPMAAKIKQNNIKLIILDSGMKERIADSTISTDNFKAGIKIGSVLRKYVGKEGKLGIISFVKNSYTAIERERGVREVFNDIPDSIVETKYCNSDAYLAYKQTKSLLQENPDITALAALNQYSVEGAARAVVDMGLERKVKIVGMDNSKVEIQYLEQGAIEGLVVQNPINMGYLGIEKAVALLEANAIPKIIDSGCILVTKENMYSGMYEKLLFPFLDE